MGGYTSHTVAATHHIQFITSSVRYYQARCSAKCSRSFIILRLCFGVIVSVGVYGLESYESMKQFRGPINVLSRRFITKHLDCKKNGRVLAVQTQKSIQHTLGVGLGERRDATEQSDKSCCIIY